MKKFIFLFIIFAQCIHAQVLITTRASNVVKPDASAVLHIAGGNKGLLMPRINLNNDTDDNTVPTPVDGLILFNTKSERFNFWHDNKWNKNIEIEDALNIIKSTRNYIGKSTGTTNITAFPTTMPLFTLESNTTGWKSLGTTLSINIAKANNTTLVNVEGMAQLDNVNQTNREFQFAIGIFVDGKLKVVRKFYKFGQPTCTWKKFNASGVFNDLSVGSHTIEVYAVNLPKVGSTTGYTQISYGGASGTCDNMNEDMARIFISAQITQ